MYVDDFKMSGPSKNMAEGWKLIRRGLQMDDPEPIGLYLGCVHEPFEMDHPSGGEVRQVRYNMEEYLRSTVTKYVELVRKTTGAEPKLSKVPTPFLQENHSENPAARP